MVSLLSEFETHDTLAFVKSSTPTPEEKEQVLAPSIEQVNSNPEELRTLRGTGRYFGAKEGAGRVSKAERKCINCFKRGHRKRNCPHVICASCGLMDDHYTKECPETMRCANCNGQGHYRSQCPHSTKRIYCTLCNSSHHMPDRCPSIWRSYYMNESICRTSVIEKVYCYNCGHQGHFGDDCWEYRSSKVPNDDGSAFSGKNLSQSLQPEYYQHLQNSRRQMNTRPRKSKTSELNTAAESRSLRRKAAKKKWREAANANSVHFQPSKFRGPSRPVSRNNGSSSKRQNKSFG